MEVFGKTKDYFQSYLILGRIAYSCNKRPKIFVDLHQRKDHNSFMLLMLNKFGCKLITIELFSRVQSFKNLARLIKYSACYFLYKRRLNHIDELYSLSFTGLSTLKDECRRKGIVTREIVHGLVNWKLAYSEGRFRGVDTIYSYEEISFLDGPQIIVDTDVRYYVLGAPRNQRVVKSLDKTLHGYWLDGEIFNSDSVSKISRFIEDYELTVLLHPSKTNGISLLETIAKHPKVVFYGYYTSSLLKMQKKGFRVVQVVVLGDSDQPIIENVDIFYLQ